MPIYALAAVKINACHWPDGWWLVQVGRTEVTVVIQTYCERENVPPTIDRIRIALSNVDWEIVFVDDGSPDGTAAPRKASTPSLARRRRPHQNTEVRSGASIHLTC